MKFLCHFFDEATFAISSRTKYLCGDLMTRALVFVMDEATNRRARLRFLFCKFSNEIRHGSTSFLK
jgi:hypothetical protein